MWISLEIIQQCSNKWWILKRIAFDGNYWCNLTVCQQINTNNELKSKVTDCLLTNHTHTHTHIYIYIYIIYHLEKTQTGHIRIINLFPSCYVFLIKSKNTHTQKINETSSDIIDKINQNRHRKEGWEGIEEGWRVISSFSRLPLFIWLSVRIIVNWFKNYYFF